MAPRLDLSVETPGEYEALAIGNRYPTLSEPPKEPDMTDETVESYARKILHRLEQNDAKLDEILEALEDLTNLQLPKKRPPADPPEDKPRFELDPEKIAD